MVRRVVGQANDFEIVLSREEGDRWATAIPANLSGEYAIELYAEDAAGNMSYMASAILIIDATTLCAHIIIDSYRAELIDDGITASVASDGYAELCDMDFTADIICEDYTAEILLPACGRR